MGEEYLCQLVLPLWREIYVSEEEGAVLEGDKIREYSAVALSGNKTCFWGTL